MENPFTWTLPSDDILLEIFSKLPVKSLLRFRCVSKSWRDLISHRHSHKKLPPAMAGLFNGGGSCRKFPFISLGSKTYVDLNSIDTAFSFLPAPHHARLRVLDSCNGLLLLSNLGSLFVCNPATRRWAQISNPPTDSVELVLAFDSHRSTHYKVVSFPLPYNMMYCWGREKVEVFSSETSEWKVVRGIRGLDEICFTNTRIVFSNETFYILDVFSGRTFSVDLERKDCQPIKWPDSMPPRTGLYNQCFGFSQGLLHFAFILAGELHVWVLDDSRSSSYVSKHRNSFQAILKQLPRGERLQNQVVIMAFHQDLDLIFLQILSKLFSYSLVSTELKEISWHVNAERPFFAYSPSYSEDADM